MGQNVFCFLLSKNPVSFFLIHPVGKKNISQTANLGCECWGPDDRLDNNIGRTEICHISMSYAPFDIIWHYMSYNVFDIGICH